MSGITGRRRRIALRCAVLSGSFILLLAPATPATAQAVWRDDAVPLVVRPPVGDTLWLQLEQTIERRGGRAASSSVPSVGAGTGLTDGYAGEQPAVRPRLPEYGPRQALASRHSTRFILYAHSLVESSDQAVTTLLATTDSLALWAGTAAESGNPEWLALPAGGRQVRVRVTPDGAMRLSDPPGGAAARGAMWSAMPALLPASPVRVGDQWVRDVVLPAPPLSGDRADGVIRTLFRLDSLTARGRYAWISLRGELHRDGTARELPIGARRLTAGTVRGTMVLDRRRAWIIDARTIIDVQSDVTPASAEAAGLQPLDVRIVQRMRMR